MMHLKKKKLNLKDEIDKSNKFTRAKNQNKNIWKKG